MFDDDERMRELEERYEGYEVYDRNGEKIGKVDDLFVDETDREEYIGVKMGLLGLSGTTMIPMDLARVNETERTIEVAETKEHVKDAPNYSDEDDIDLEFEARIRDHFGLEGMETSPERGTYGRYAGAAAGGGVAGGAAAGTTAAGPGMDREPSGMNRSGDPGGIDRGGDLGGMDRGEPGMERQPGGMGGDLGGGVERQPGGIGGEPGGMDRDLGGIDRGEPGGMDRDLGTTGGADRDLGGIDRGGDLGGMDRGDQTRETPRSSTEGGQEESMGTRVRRRIRRIVE